ncbi:hypothetical protein LFM09_49425 [Lentzea alba]|uniref:hypothetical protein n=1 Tax=Lentzea alba TaxID=2714351 RepID=UPI0039BF0A3E
MTAGDGLPLPELPPEVVAQIENELPERGGKVVAALKTAAALLGSALSGDSDLRLAESAVYNLREALDAVVSGRTPVAGGLPAVLDAWGQYESEVAQSDNDDDASLEKLKVVLRKVAEKRDRNSVHAARLLGYLKAKAGVDPLSGQLDPVVEYNRLRQRASAGLHTDTALAHATTLYESTIAWFVRMFTPPDDVVRALRELAVEPWNDSDQIDRLRALATNHHHLRLFLSSLSDPAWLEPLYEAEVLTAPEPGTAWSGGALVDGLGRTAPAMVAALLASLFADSKHLPVEQRLEARFQLLSVATQLGEAGHGIVGDVMAAHPDNRAVRALAVGAVKKAAPAARVVDRVARCVLNAEPMGSDRYYYKTVLEPLVAGLNAENVVGRVRMMVAKVRDAAGHETAAWVVQDISRLTTDLGDDDRYYLVIISHYLARLIGEARRFGVTTAQLREWVGSIPGVAGERLMARVLAEAEDVPVAEKIEYVRRRLAGSPTGDDKDLIDEVLANDPEPDALAIWREALGTPSTMDSDVVPRDWVNAWLWSAVLPDHVLEAWQAEIAHVTAKYGPPEVPFDTRTPTSAGYWSRSPHSAEQLAALPVLTAAELVAQWRPDEAAERELVSARELARALQAAVEQNTIAWAVDPAAVVRILREPVHVSHYFVGLSKKVGEVVSQVDSIIAAGELGLSEQWPPNVLGRDNDFDYDADWGPTEVAFVDLIGALADHDAPIGQHLDALWSRASALIDRDAHSGDLSSGGRDYLNSALNSRRGRGLYAVLALAAWEHRQQGKARSEFIALLDELVRLPGAVGMEYRAVLAHKRLRLEVIASSWLEENLDVLFRDSALGDATFDLTLKYSSRSTPWFYEALRDDLFEAAKRKSEGAVMWILAAVRDDVPGYDVETVIRSFRGDADLLAAVLNDSAFLVQERAGDSPAMEKAVATWRAALDANQAVVPVEALKAAGRWAFVAGLSNETWTDLTLRTLQLTNGEIDYSTDVAERCQPATVPGQSTSILLALLGKGEPWEQHHIAGIAMNVLRELSDTRSDENFDALRIRLIELGYHDATDLAPHEAPQADWPADGAG